MFSDTPECPTRLTPGAIRALLCLRLHLGLWWGLVPGPGTAKALPSTATLLCIPSCGWGLSVSVLSSSWWITASSSASGGCQNLKSSSFLIRGQFLTITFIQKRSHSVSGMKECQRSSSTPTSPYRYFPRALCLSGLFDCQSTAFPSVMCGASSGLRLVAPIKPDGFQWFSLPHRSLRQGL